MELNIPWCKLRHGSMSFVAVYHVEYVMALITSQIEGRLGYFSMSWIFLWYVISLNTSHNGIFIIMALNMSLVFQWVHHDTENVISISLSVIVIVHVISISVSTSRHLMSWVFHWVHEGIEYITCVVGVMKMGNIVPRVGLKHISLAFRASVLPLHHIGFPDVTFIPTPTCLYKSLPQRPVQSTTLVPLEL